MIIKNETWEVFLIYLSQAIDFFESIEDRDFEVATLEEQLREMYCYSPEDDE